MSASEFWHNVLEEDEKLLWTGRPKPRLHWRNWRLYGPAPMAALGLMAGASLILVTAGTEGDIWLLILPALLILIPVRATWQQLRQLRATRYALTDRRVLFFHVSGDQTRVRAFPAQATVPALRRETLPASVSFLRQAKGKKRLFGFEYIENAQALMQHLEEIRP